MKGFVDKVCDTYSNVCSQWFFKWEIRLDCIKKFVETPTVTPRANASPPLDFSSFTQLEIISICCQAYSRNWLKCLMTSPVQFTSLGILVINNKFSRLGWVGLMSREYYFGHSVDVERTRRATRWNQLPRDNWNHRTTAIFENEKSVALCRDDKLRRNPRILTICFCLCKKRFQTSVIAFDSRLGIGMKFPVKWAVVSLLKIIDLFWNQLLFMRLFVVAARRGRQEQVFVVQKLSSTSLGTAARRYEFNFQFCARSSWGRNNIVFLDIALWLPWALQQKANSEQWF